MHILVSLSLSLSLSIYIYIYLCLSVSLSVSLCLSLTFFLSLSLSLSVCLSVCLSLCLSVSLSINLSCSFPFQLCLYPSFSPYILFIYCQMACSPSHRLCLRVRNVPASLAPLLFPLPAEEISAVAQSPLLHCELHREFGSEFMGQWVSQCLCIVRKKKPGNIYIHNCIYIYVCVCLCVWLCV